MRPNEDSREPPVSLNASINVHRCDRFFWSICHSGCERGGLFGSVGGAGALMLRRGAASGGEADGREGVGQQYRQCAEQPSPATGWVSVSGSTSPLSQEEHCGVHRKSRFCIFQIFFFFLKILFCVFVRSVHHSVSVEESVYTAAGWGPGSPRVSLWLPLCTGASAQCRYALTAWGDNA